MKGYRQQRKKFISLMGEPDFKRLMERYNRAAVPEREKIEEFLNGLLNGGQDASGDEQAGETLQLSREEMKKIQEGIRKRSQGGKH